MVERLIGFFVQYAGYLLELALFVYILLWGQGRRLFGVCVFLASLLIIDLCVRPYTLSVYGLRSSRYYYVYWLSDVLLTFEAFLLICFFYRRAFHREQRLWRLLRQTLIFVFVLVVVVSSTSLYKNYSHNHFMDDFQQNLYFACLVLNTLLYIKMQSMRTRDQELVLLVCGMGVQFAGSAACLAFGYLTRGHHPQFMFSYVTQFCSLGLLLIWIYAIVGVPKSSRVPASAKKIQEPSTEEVQEATGGSLKAQWGTK
jgi:hypothetical protein